MRGLRAAAFVALAAIVAGCGSAATSAAGDSAVPSTAPASAAPATSATSTADVSTGSYALVGSAPGTLALTVGTHAAGFGGVTCLDLGNGQLSVLDGDPKEGEWIALVIRSDGTVSSLSGALRGVSWMVTQNPQGTLTGNRSGTFSGKDAISGADVTGTFACL